VGGGPGAQGGTGPGSQGGTNNSGGSSAGGSSATGGRSGAAGGRSSTSGGAAAAGGNNTAGTLSTTKFVGNITTGDVADTNGMVFAKHWDQITPENAGKWGNVQANTGQNFNWSRLDQLYDYAQQNNLPFKQHTFVWGSQQPGGNVDEAAVKRWMTEYCKRYPNTQMIDVVNEPPPHRGPSYANAIGGGTDSSWQWITNSFKWAREACPKAILILNDYNNIEWSTDHQHFLSIVLAVQAAGAPIDAIGAQSHDLDNANVSAANVKKMLRNLNDQTGLPVYISEFDISTTDDAAQLAAYQQWIPYFLEQSYIPGITIWGWIYGRTWADAPNSGLIRNNSPRPAWTWLMQQLNRPER